MNSIIKTLEEIGQKTSIKSHESVVEMLNDLKIKNKKINEIDISLGELICGLFPADDTESDNEEETDDKEEE